jgi:hypothetical protein
MMDHYVPPTHTLVPAATRRLYSARRGYTLPAPPHLYDQALQPAHRSFCAGRNSQPASPMRWRQHTELNGLHDSSCWN